jgi:hypothetical protein
MLSLFLDLTAANLHFTPSSFYVVLLRCRRLSCLIAKLMILPIDRASKDDSIGCLTSLVKIRVVASDLELRSLSNTLFY